MMNAHFDLMFLTKQPQPANPKAPVLLLHGVGGSQTNLIDLAAAMDSDAIATLGVIAVMQVAAANLRFSADRRRFL